MNNLYKQATNPKSTLEERWKAVHMMIDQRKEIPSDIAEILSRTSRRRRG